MTDGLQFGALGGELEIRRLLHNNKTVIAGSFPYRKRAVLSDGGRYGNPQKEEFDSRAFAYRVEKPDEEIFFLAGHRYDKPLASKLNKTLILRDSDQALVFEAIILPEIEETSYARDILSLLKARLAKGVSPGFRLPPERAVAREVAEVITQEPVNPAKGQHGARIRTIKQALLFELSIVTQAAYPDAQAEARNWAADNRANTALPDFLRRWRY